MRPLFIAGSPRSGTTALTNYLNLHPKVLVCRERYKFVAPKEITPELFTFNRIRNHRKRETNTPEQYHSELLAGKNSDDLEWIGDKYPHYIKRLERLSKNNPGARFLITYRPVEEVAESFERRARNPKDRWPEENGFEAGVKIWNASLKHTREFARNGAESKILIVNYHDFFSYQNESYARLLSKFLEIEFDESLIRTWQQRSTSFESSRRGKDPVSSEQAAYIQENKDLDAERWILGQLERQWKELANAKNDESFTVDKNSLIEVASRRNGRANVTDVAEGHDTYLDLSNYDFLDFGASKGGSTEFALQRLGGAKGLGVDLDPAKVERMRSRGYECVQGDVTSLDLPAEAVRFVVMSHFLEHMSDQETVRGAIESAARVSSDFLFIQGPYFDADEYLESEGLKFYWSDWHGHSCRLTSSQLREILLDLGLDDHVMMARAPVQDSSDSAIHPLDSPRDQHGYEPGVHPERPSVTFPQTLYKEMVCCVRLRPFEGWENVLRARGGSRRLAVAGTPGGVELDKSRSNVEKQSIAEKEPEPVIPEKTAGRLRELEERLMSVRRWSYLRYLHLREGLIHAPGVESVLAVGCGRGYAELALALEFPEIRFHLTDIESETTPNYQNARGLAERWGLANVTFGVRDILEPEPDRYDLVTSVEVLEHIEDDARAADSMRAAADKYVFVLVPFADQKTNANEKLRNKVLESHGHYRVGYDSETLQDLLSHVVAMRGCYWKEYGGKLREKLNDLSEEEIRSSLTELGAEARHDIVEAVPASYPEAQGIWVLSRV